MSEILTSELVEILFEISFREKSLLKSQSMIEKDFNLMFIIFARLLIRETVAKH